MPRQRQYDHTHKGRVENAMELTKVANHRFGYEQALAMVLQGPLSVGGARTEKMLELARDRKLDEFNEMLKESTP